jgi:hypothetical protein
MAALRWSRADEAAAALESESLRDGAYNPFNLLVADAEDCFLFTYDESARRIELGPGAHVIGNTDPETARTPKLAGVARNAERIAAAGGDGVLEALAEVCATHTGSENAFDDTCVHAGDYGTRSSFLLKLGEKKENRVLRFADGAPCCTKYEDYTPLLHDLRHRPGYGEGATAARSAS